MENEKIGKFFSKFDFDKYGFKNPVFYTDGSIGFSIRKDSVSKDGNATQLSVYVYEDDLNSKDSNRKPLVIHTTYGVVTSDGGIRIRSNPKLSDPIDFESTETYYYNIVSGDFYKENENISANKIIDEIYKKHMKSTKSFFGFWLRSKIFFWKLFLSTLFKFISDTFCLLLYVVSGDRYSYAPFFEEETLNGEIIKSRLDIPKIIKAKEEVKRSKKILLLGYDAPYWPIIFYAILHGLLYLVFMHYNYKPILITTLLKNNFLTIIYVILSLWFLEKVIPSGLKSLVKIFSKLSFRSQYKSISV